METRLDGKFPVVFSDFDGTITERDVIVMIMEAFAPPVWQDITRQILEERTLSIRDGVAKLFSLIPGSKKQEIIEFVHREVRIRPGFSEFLAFCHQQGIPFYVLSGGLDFFIEPVLAPYRHRLRLFCNGARFLPDTIEVTTPFLHLDCPGCGQCGCCKVNIITMRSTPQTYRIAIGDSLTDLPMARLAHRTFARSKLIGYCQDENLPFTPYETFFDIQKALETQLTREEASAHV